MYGGSTTSILVNIPGETASVVTCLDGYQMARQGGAGRALGIFAFGSFIAGTLGLFGLMLMAPMMVRFALRFGPSEYFSLMALGIVLIIFLAQGSLLKSLLMARVGLLLSTVGTDSISGTYRFTFGHPILMDGIGLIPVTMGMFGVEEVLSNIEEGWTGKSMNPGSRIYSRQERTGEEASDPSSADPHRIFLGVLPGGGACLPRSHPTSRRSAFPGPLKNSGPG